jgi:hypothetical protein
VAVIFPRWTNKLPVILLGALFFGGIGTIGFIWYYFSPEYTDVGYAPKQPVPFSHKKHAGDLGLDCRFCHYSVERASYAAIPPTQTCMGCHGQTWGNILPKSKNLKHLRDKHNAKLPVEWKRVHMLPDYAFFNHKVHISAGVGCATCHGRIDQMKVVHQSKSLSMGWCLKCHRNPNPNLRPRSQVTNMGWDQTAAKKKYKPWLDLARHVGGKLKNGLKRKDIMERRKMIAKGKVIRPQAFFGLQRTHQFNPKTLVVNPPQHCSGCHR